MKILFYIPELTQAAGGIRQYAATLLQILANDPENEYYILHNNNDPFILSVISNNPSLKLIPTGTGKEKKWEKWLTDIARTINFMLWRIKSQHKLPVYHFVQRIVRKYKIDIIHCPYQFAPYSKSAAIICTLHDIQELHFPAYFSSRERIERGLAVEDMQQRASNVVVSYEHIKADLELFYQTSPDKVTVCLLDMSNLWTDKYTHVKTVDMEPSYQVNGPFLLYPANTWPHKNHQGLIESVHYIREHHGEHITIVCTGYITEHYNNVLKPLIDKYGLHPAIRFAGVVNEDTLFYLYKTALGVVVPTTYEAGSFPLMESMLLEVPVICSNVTSLPETVGDSRFTFDPFDVKIMANAIFRFWSDPSLRNESVENGRKMSLLFRKKGALKQLTDLYESLKSKHALVKQRQ